MDARALRFEVEDLYFDYVECLDDGELERWPDFFTDVCLYKIIPRDNFERGLPLALMLCESKNMLRDRVAAVRQTSVYVPRALRHLLSNIRIKSIEPGSSPALTPASPHALEPSAAIRVQANYAVLQTLPDDETRVFNAGKYVDQLVREDGRLKFKEKLCVFDSILVPGSLIWPL
jgi:3-phenylpropionate/cinnamic acid dioxygenase small subunit